MRQSRSTAAASAFVWHSIRELRGTRMLFFRIGGVTVEVVGGAQSQTAERSMAWRTAYSTSMPRMPACARPASTLSELRPGNKPGTRVFTVRDGTAGVPTLILRDPARG